MPDPSFSPTRSAALARLHAFVPRAGRAYAEGRNHDDPDGVSGLSPWIRHRVLTEAEVLEAVLARHAPQAADKFVAEVYWRTYWKGWLEMRPGVWVQYREGLRRALDDVATQSGLRMRWEAACRGETGIACFDHWARDLAATGYLHNHARMWFASIWIFTLRLPWELGADFFLRHLLDGDAASNTLSWRWVGGLQTRGKTYLATPDNIARYTRGRFRPGPAELAAFAEPLDGPEPPPPMAAPAGDGFDPAAPSVLLLHEDDLSPDWLFDAGLRPRATAVLAPRALSPLAMAPGVLSFRVALMRDALDRHAERLGPVTWLEDAGGLADWAAGHGATQVVTPFAPVGAVAEALQGQALRRVLRRHDAEAWPHARAGFFKFRERIPALLARMRGLSVA